MTDGNYMERSKLGIFSLKEAKKKTNKDTDYYNIWNLNLIGFMKS